MDTIQEIIDAVKKHAHEHYNEDGWDYVVEAWEDEEIYRVLTEANATTIEKGIKAMKKHIAPLAEQRAMAISEGGGCPECLSFDTHAPNCSKKGKWRLENDQ